MQRFRIHWENRECPGKFHFAPAMGGHQETELEGVPLGSRQFTPHIGIDQVCFRRFEFGSVTGIGKCTVLDEDLFVFSSIPEQVLDQQPFVVALWQHSDYFRSLAIMANFGDLSPFLAEVRTGYKLRATNST